MVKATRGLQVSDRETVKGLPIGDGVAIIGIAHPYGNTSKKVKGFSQDSLEELEFDDEENTFTPIKKGKKVAKKVKKAVVKKLKNTKHVVAGTVTLDGEGNVLRFSKGVIKVARGRKDRKNEYVVSFTFKTKVNKSK